VSASRGGRAILREITLDVEEGTTAVLGASGSGKSTLLRLLNRLADPDTGTISHRGTDVRSVDVLDLRRRVVLVPQLPAPLAGSVEHNVGYGARLAGRRADVERALRLAGLDGGFAEREAERLSVGEQQRVMLARALALEPEVLLLDEPTAALDEEAKEGVEGTIRELENTLSVSFLVVTHDRGQASRLGTRTIEIDAGRVTRG